MVEAIESENGTFRKFYGHLTLIWKQGQGHIVVHHSSSTTHIPNFISIGETLCGRTDGHRPNKVQSHVTGHWRGNSKMWRDQI